MTAARISRLTLTLHTVYNDDPKLDCFTCLEGRVEGAPDWMSPETVKAIEADMMNNKKAFCGPPMGGYK